MDLRVFDAPARGGRKPSVDAQHLGRGGASKTTQPPGAKNVAPPTALMTTGWLSPRSPA